MQFAERNAKYRTLVLNAETRASQWLADGNEARERGDAAKAEKCYAKSQYWLDRYNRLTGRGDE